MNRFITVSLICCCFVIFQIAYFNRLILKNPIFLKLFQSEESGIEKEEEEEEKKDLLMYDEAMNKLDSFNSYHNPQ